MEKIKMLLYCTKSKPYLIGRKDTPYKYYLDKGGKYSNMDGRDFIHNGKIVAECDFEVDSIVMQKGADDKMYGNNGFMGYGIISKNHSFSWYDENKTCLPEEKLFKYLKGKNGYAIHIKNLNIFDKPKGLREYTTRKPKTYETMTCDSCMENIDCKRCSYNYEYQEVMKAPQNMMKVCEWNLKDYVLISIRPEWLCKILNGEKTIECRKRILKEMMQDG